jgi:hypothetical protein
MEEWKEFVLNGMCWLFVVSFPQPQIPFLSGRKCQSQGDFQPQSHNKPWGEGELRLGKRNSKNR